MVFEYRARSRAIKTLHVLLLAISFLAASPSAWPQKKPVKSASPEQKTARYFESVRNQPLLLHAFLQQMPKGGDLHNHLSGAVYAESYIKWAAQDGLCVDSNALALTQPPCDPANGKPSATAALQDPTLYGHLLDAFSMRQFHSGPESGHDHFFATFGKFGAATNNHTAEMLAEVRERAAAGHLLYMELMFNPDGGAAARLGAQLGWNDDLNKMREQLFGCDVKARYLYQVARGLPREMVFAQILAGFEMASKDPRVVGLNLVMAEEWYVPVHDFNLHMRMLDFLHRLCPKVHVTLHAGELTPQLVSPEELFHVRASIVQGHAERIGHGVDVMQEADPEALLRMMVQKGILVEVCLTSNDVILNVTGSHHPLPMYLKYGVHVALATDDPGVSRGDITQEYQRAAETYHLSYLDLKMFARASLEYSFLPGESIWKDSSKDVRAPACRSDNPASSNTSFSCSRFLAANEKARQQWALEKAFTEFERKF